MEQRLGRREGYYVGGAETPDLVARSDVQMERDATEFDGALWAGLRQMMNHRREGRWCGGEEEEEGR